MYTYGIASSLLDRQKSADLVKEVYGESDYISDNGQTVSSIGRHLYDKNALTFIARDEDEVVGTISVVNDSKTGLPLDVLFQDELAMFKQMGARVAEVCQFAIDKKKVTSAVPVALSSELIGLAFHYALYKKTDYLCFTINPKHRLFYESLGCIQVGKEKTYKAVNDKPALAFVFNMRNLHAASAHPVKSNWLISRILRNPPSYQLFVQKEHRNLFPNFFPLQILKYIANRF